jgi:NADH:ubiquinone oxidoreductase subunit 3 (subunit A)
MLYKEVLPIIIPTRALISFGEVDIERDDETLPEKYLNIFLFFILLMSIIGFMIQLNHTFKSYGKKEYNRIHYVIILLIFSSVILRYFFYLQNY